MNEVDNIFIMKCYPLTLLKPLEWKRYTSICISFCTKSSLKMFGNHLDFKIIEGHLGELGLYFRY